MTPTDRGRLLFARERPTSQLSQLWKWGSLGAANCGAIIGDMEAKEKRELPALLGAERKLPALAKRPHRHPLVTFGANRGGREDYGLARQTTSGHSASL